MTLIVGIRCANGIVMAADGAATLGSVGAATAQQRTHRKLVIFQSDTIVGIAGHIGLAQRLTATLEDGRAANAFVGRAETAVGIMREKMWRVAGPEWEAAGVVRKSLAEEAACESAACETLVALPLDGNAQLVHFNRTCSPELATDALPWVAIGSGQRTADPFLAFIRRVFWTSPTPSVQDGIFSAVWTLRHAVETGADGIAEPFQVCLLETANATAWAARQLPEDELIAHDEAISDAEAQLRMWRVQLSGAPTGEAPAATQMIVARLRLCPKS